MQTDLPGETGKPVRTGACARTPAARPTFDWRLGVTRPGYQKPGRLAAALDRYWLIGLPVGLRDRVGDTRRGCVRGLEH